MSDGDSQLLGLAGFVVSAILFLVAAVQAGDVLIILGCGAWIGACVVWALPLLKERGNRRRP